MSTPHIEAQNGDYAETVLLPGDPLRAKYIAENFLTNVKQVNSVRNETGQQRAQRIWLHRRIQGPSHLGSRIGDGNSFHVDLYQ